MRMVDGLQCAGSESTKCAVTCGVRNEFKIETPVDLKNSRYISFLL